MEKEVCMCVRMCNCDVRMHMCYYVKMCIRVYVCTCVCVSLRVHLADFLRAYVVWQTEKYYVHGLN